MAILSGVNGPPLLVHVCCAPCAEYPIGVLQGEGIPLRGFFFNPNIHPADEFRRRKEGVRTLMAMRGIPCDFDDTFLQPLWEGSDNRTPGSLCTECYGMRMKRVADVTCRLGLSEFTTTLLVSPYQNHDLLREVAERAAFEAGVRFHYRDFRPGFRKGQDMARQDGLYRQKYCGCIHSLEASPFRDRITLEHLALREQSSRDRSDVPGGSGNSRR